MRYLQKHEKRQAVERRTLDGAWQEHGLVYPSSIGTPIEPRNANRRRDELRKEAAMD